VRVSALILALAAPVAAGAFELALPIACTLGEDCYIQQFVDHDPSPGAQDFRCGTLSYDGHEGTDFGIPTLADMARGVPVIAAAAGEVTGLRDGMPDIVMEAEGAPDIAGRECGNGVLLRHPDGWETQYCHLRQGSISVAQGDRVAAGDVLGMVGLSGMTEFPHVHLTVRHNGRVVDPFTPDGPETCGAPPGPTLWTDPPPYVAGGLLTSGFASEVPDYDAIKAGAPITPPTRDTALVLWGYFFGGQMGDVVEIAIDGPGGEVIRHTALLEGKQGIFFRAAGRRAPDGGWPSGTYDGTLHLLRGDALIDTGRISITLPG
jgi:hypothetical protein